MEDASNLEVPARALAHVKVRVLGGFSVCVGKQQTALTHVKRPKAQELLVLLCVKNRHRFSKDELSDLLWHDKSRDGARAELSRSIYVLRQVLDVGLDTRRYRSCILTDAKSVALNEEIIDVDITEFERVARLLTSNAVSNASLQHALEIYKGGISGGLFSSPLLESRNISLLQDLETLTHALATRLHEDQQFERCRALFSRQLSFEPANESAHQGLMRSLLSLGRRTDVLRQFELCKKALRDELGVTVSRASIALAEAARTDKMTTSNSGDSDLPIKTAPSVPPAEDRFVPPAMLHPIFGRDDLVRELRTLLSKDSIRMLTLTGFGGIGKTAIATALANSAMAGFPDGVCWVRLEGIVARDDVPLAICNSMNIQHDGVRSSFKQIQDRLKNRTALLVLDGCEHLDIGADLIDTLLAGCVNLKVLATSRVGVGASAETVFSVGPLPIGDTNNNRTEYEMDPGSALIVHAARRCKTHFQLQSDDVALLRELARLLDGIPLALVLAAARLRVQPLRDLLTSIQSASAFFSEAGDGSARHASLSHVVMSSHSLLSVACKRVFGYLGVFRGVFSLDAACIVAQLDRADCVQTIDRLLEIGFIYEVPSRNDIGAGFAMLPTLRSFALTDLNRHGAEYENAHTLHAKYFLDVAVRLNHQLKTAAGAAIASFRRNLDNIRAASDWFDAKRQQIPRLQIGVAVARFHHRISQFEDISERVETLISSSSEPEYLTYRADLIYLQGAALVRKGNLDQAAATMMRALSMWQTAGDTHGIAFAACGIANLMQGRQDSEETQRLLAIAVENARLSNDAYLLAYSNLVLACLLVEIGKVRESLGHFNTAVVHTATDAVVLHAPACISWLGAQVWCDPDTADLRLIDRAVQAADTAGVPYYKQLVHEQASNILIQLGELGLAETHLLRCAEYSGATQNPMMKERAILAHAVLAILRQRSEEAMSILAKHAGDDKNSEISTAFEISLLRFGLCFKRLTEAEKISSLEWHVENWSRISAYLKLMFGDVFAAFLKTIGSEKSSDELAVLCDRLRDLSGLHRRRIDGVLVSMILGNDAAIVINASEKLILAAPPEAATWLSLERAIRHRLLTEKKNTNITSLVCIG
jgi:predicted ATPase/DNA-binding SARP family transcriptional activator